MIACMEQFADATRDWFADTLGEPTPVQRQAWPAIASGANVLVIAPTGSGKTLAAFLAAIDALMRSGGRDGLSHRHGVRVLYISPLKALAVDVAKNLTAPLEGIRDRLRSRSMPAPTIRVAIRSGDTTARERRAIVAHPPDILVTTPESLYLLLTSKARSILSDVDTVILDEVHALAGSKRGAHLALSLERLEAWTGAPTQRIGLSATVRPAQQAARFIGGGRPVTIVEPKSDPGMDLAVRYVTQDHLSTGAPSRDRMEFAGQSGTSEDEDERASRSIWPDIERSVLNEILRHHTTLVFVNSRGLAEKLTARLNDLYAQTALGHPRTNDYAGVRHYDAVVGSTSALVGSHDDADAIAMAHHGSVSKERRKRIEEGLKHGRLRCVVATSSLELGIDMGSVDLVIQIAPTLSVSSGLQRVGRASHQVGGISHALFYPLTRRHLIEMGAGIESMRSGAIEPLRVLRNPLDVLAQQTVAAAAMGALDPDAWYALVRRSAPFAELDRPSFDGVIAMLTGAYDTEDFSPFRPALQWDQRHADIIARPGAQRLAVTSGGTIPDRGQYAVMMAQDDAGAGARRVGELDEEMVYESRVGDVITLGTSTWRIREITHDRVIVVPAPGQTARLPFWHGEGAGRDAEFGETCGRFEADLARGLVTSDTDGRAPRFDASVMQRLHADGMDGESCTRLAGLLDEQRKATGVLPCARQLVVERCLDEEDDWTIMLHSSYGRRVHEPWALAIAHRLQAEFGFDGRCYASDDGIVVHVPQTYGELSDDRIFLFDAEELERVVTQQVGDSVLFAARFRECAARSLYMPRTRPGRRIPLWQQRLRASQLLAAARRRRDFPLLLETARECLQDVYDMPALTAVMRRIVQGDITLHDVHTDVPSPFARDLLFGSVGEVMYQSDAPQAERNASLLSMDMGALERLIGTGNIRHVLDPAVMRQVVEELHQVTFWNRLDDADVAGRIRRFSKTHGPFTADDMIAALGIDARAAVHELDELQAKGELLTGAFTADTDTSVVQYLHRDVFRRIRNRSLDKARRAVKPVESESYQRFVMRRQGVGPVGKEPYEGHEGLLRVIEQLEGVGLPASVWEEAVFPSRVRDYTPAMLDAALAAGEIIWVGSSNVADGSSSRIPGDIAWYPANSVMLPPPDSSDLQRDGQDPRGSGRDDASRRRCAEAMLQVLRSGGAYPSSRLFALCRAAARDGDGGEAPADQESQIVDERTGEIMADVRAADWGDTMCDDVLWSLVWRGIVTSSSFAPIRMLCGHDGRRRHRVRPRPAHSGLMRMRMKPRVGVTPPPSGLWSIVMPQSDANAPERRVVAIIEALLDRYGVVSRPVIEKERIPGGFSRLYPALRRMEDMGVVLRGMFIAGCSPAQFARRETVDALRRMQSVDSNVDADDPAVICIDAVDPANLAGWVRPWPPQAGSGGVRPSHRAGDIVAFAHGRPVLVALPSSHHLLRLLSEESAEHDSGNRPGDTVDDLRSAFGQLGRYLSRGSAYDGSANTIFGDIDGMPFTVRNRYTALLRQAGFTAGPRGMTWYR